MAPPAPADLSPVAALASGAARVGDFDDDELILARLLVHLHEVANSVVPGGDDAGFIALPVWRGEHTKPHNARPLENHVGLALFLTCDRPWNPYCGDPALRRRLELVIGRFARLQHPDGTFDEYRPGDRALAPTAFGARFMAETLRLIERAEARDGAPAIDPGVKAAARAAARGAILAVLTRADFWKHGGRYANQFAGILGGAACYLDTYPDDRDAARLRGLLLDRYAASLDEHRSPVGHPYEADGCDWNYTLGTEGFNKSHALLYAAAGDPLHDLILADEREWVDWLSLNAVPEPDGGFWALNRAIESRTAKAGFDRWASPLGDVIDLARAFAPTPEEAAAKARGRRAELAAAWPDLGPLHRYRPEQFVSWRVRPPLPSADQRDAARAPAVLRPRPLRAPAGRRPLPRPLHLCPPTRRRRGRRRLLRGVRRRQAPRRPPAVRPWACCGTPPTARRCKARAARSPTGRPRGARSPTPTAPTRPPTCRSRSR